MEDKNAKEILLADPETFVHHQVLILLNNYSKFLEKNGYLDSDWREEEPTAIDKFMNEND